MTNEHHWEAEGSTRSALEISKFRELGLRVAAALHGQTLPCSGRVPDAAEPPSGTPRLPLRYKEPRVTGKLWHFFIAHRQLLTQPRERHDRPRLRRLPRHCTSSAPRSVRSRRGIRESWVYYASASIYLLIRVYHWNFIRQFNFYSMRLQFLDYSCEKKASSISLKKTFSKELFYSQSRRRW